METKTLLVLLFALVAAAALAGVFEKPKVVGNRELLSYIRGLEARYPQKNVSIQEAAALRKLFEGDEYAQEAIEEIEWFAGKNLGLHAVHGLGLLELYVKTGRRYDCFPHDAWHVKIALGQGDEEFALKKIANLRDSYGKWLEFAEKDSKQRPEFYSDFEQVKKAAEVALNGLTAKRFDAATFSAIDLLVKKAVC